MMLTVVPITAAASDALSVSKTEACIGDTVTVKFTQPVTQTMSGVTLGLSFDKDAFEVVDIANVPYAALQPDKTSCNNVGRIAISWTDPTYDANTVLNAGTELLSITFAVKENASLGEKAFRVTEYIVTGGFDMTTYMPEDITPDIGSSVKNVTVSSFILDMSFISADDAAIVSEMLHNPEADIFTDAMRFEADVLDTYSLNNSYVSSSDAMWILYASVGLTYEG